MITDSTRRGKQLNKRMFVNGTFDAQEASSLDAHGQVMTTMIIQLTANRALVQLKSEEEEEIVQIELCLEFCSNFVCSKNCSNSTKNVRGDPRRSPKFRSNVNASTGGQ